MTNRRQLRRLVDSLTGAAAERTAGLHSLNKGSLLDGWRHVRGTLLVCNVTLAQRQTARSPWQRDLQVRSSKCHRCTTARERASPTNKHSSTFSSGEPPRRLVDRRQHYARLDTRLVRLLLHACHRAHVQPLCHSELCACARHHQQLLR